MAPDGGIQHQRSGKASFEQIYDLEDPREYFNILGSLDYRIPHHGQQVFSTLAEERRAAGGGPVNVLDLCCSYGINAALLKYELTLEDLYERYGSEDLRELSGEELAAADTEFYRRRCKEDALRVVGLDVAANAVSYGVKAGLLDEGAVEDLENTKPSAALRETVCETDLLTVTGGVGYISERTFARVLDCVPEGEEPWVATFALRWVDYSSVAGTLAERGLVTEKLDTHTFDQRRFVNPEEHEYVCRELEKMGVDPEGKESEGCYHAEFYLSRPTDEVRERSLKELLSPALEPEVSE